MAAPSQFEQMMLELINRARLDPAGEFQELIVSINPRQGVQPNITSALNYFGVDLNVLQSQLANYQPVAPLAWNDKLHDAAFGHSQQMIAHDQQSHQLPGEPSLGQRVTNAGYSWTMVAENIFAYTQDPVHGHAGFYIDWGNNPPTGIQDPPGHRNTILNANFVEVGIASIAENDPGTNVGPYVVTQNFARPQNYMPQILGVTYDDQNNNDFYDIGEARANVSITTASGTTTTGVAGGYSIAPLTTGRTDIVFSGGGLPTQVHATIVMGTENVKVDLVDTNTLFSSTSIILGNGAKNVALLGLANLFANGNAAANVIIGNDGHNSLQGKAGNDVIHGGDGRDALFGGRGNDVLNGNAGNDILYGSIGNDTMNGDKGADVMQGDAGADKMRGGAGDDTLLGGKGKDLILGHGGNDRIEGGADNDTVDGGRGKDAIFGNAGNDTLKGGGGDDEIDGGRGSDTIHGNTGNDILKGGGGNDGINGNKGNDSLFGNFGNDTLWGGPGNDLLHGGGGYDTFVYKKGDATDRIKDFQDNIDILDLSDWNLASPAHAMNFATQVGSDVKFDFTGIAGAGGGDILWVEGITISALQDDIIV